MPAVRPIEIIRHAFRKLGRASTLGARALVFNTDGHVLLIRHTYRPGWHTPGGGVSPGEIPVEAMKRELWEEAGLTPASEPVLFAIYKHRWMGLDDYPILYVIRDETGTPFVNDPHEIAEVGWFPVDALPAETTAKTRNRIEEALGLKAISPVW